MDNFDVDLSPVTRTGGRSVRLEVLHFCGEISTNEPQNWFTSFCYFCLCTLSRNSVCMAAANATQVLLVYTFQQVPPLPTSVWEPWPPTHAHKARWLD